MTSYFLDSSAVVKRYHREAGTDWIRGLCEPQSHPPLYVSDIARVEIVAALRRTGRFEQVHPSAVDAMVNMFDRHIVLSESPRSVPVYTFIPMPPEILSLAAAYCNEYWDVRPHPLRSLDAIQLASALAVAADISDDLVFVTADLRLGAVAASEGFQVVNPAFPGES